MVPMAIGTHALAIVMSYGQRECGGVCAQAPMANRAGIRTRTHAHAHAHAHDMHIHMHSVTRTLTTPGAPDASRWRTKKVPKHNDTVLYDTSSPFARRKHLCTHLHSKPSCSLLLLRNDHSFHRSLQDLLEDLKVLQMEYLPCQSHASHSPHQHGPSAGSRRLTVNSSEGGCQLGFSYV